MTITVTHSKVSAKSDTGDASIVQPSDWNDDHIVTGAAGSQTLAEVLTTGNTTDDQLISSGSGPDGYPSTLNLQSANSGTGGALSLSAGYGEVGKDGGNALLGGGTGDDGNGGGGALVNAFGGSAGGVGATLLLSGGNASFGGGLVGGDINVLPGAGDGAGRAGVLFLNLPVTDPAVSGATWSDGGTVVLSGSTAGIVSTSTSVNVGSPNGESNVYVADAADGTPGIDISASGGAELYLDDLVYVGSSNADPALLSGSADPSAGGGVVAPQGSIYLRTNGTTWTKTGSGATAWAISGSGGGSVPAAVAAAALVYAYNTFR